jgi:hypothetical protein
MMELAKAIAGTYLSGFFGPEEPTDVLVTNTDATSYCKQTPAKVLETHQTDSSQSTGNTRKREEMY